METPMAAHLAAHLSARVAALIALHHGGDRRAAARRLGIAPDCLAGILSGDWRRFSLDALAALVRGYGIGVDWLLVSTADSQDAGTDDARRRRRPARAITVSRGARRHRALAEALEEERRCR